MRKLVAPVSLAGFFFVNLAIGVMIAASAAGGPEIIGLVIGIPCVLVAAFAPEVAGKAGIPFSPGLATACRRLAVVFMVPLILAATGTRQLVRLGRGTIVNGISVKRVAEFPSATGFELTDGRARLEFGGQAVNTKGRTSDHWYAAPLVDDDWMPEIPVTAWVLHLDGVQPEVVQGRFHGALVWDRKAASYRYGVLAVRDAESRHGLRSDPNAVILEMGESVDGIRTAYTALLVLAFGATNLTWLLAVLMNPAPATRPRVRPVRVRELATV